MARPSAPVVQVFVIFLVGFLLNSCFQTFRAGSIEIISTGSALSPSVGRPVIEIDLGVRRRNRARGGINNDMVGVTVDRELPREEEEEEDQVVNEEEEEEVDSSQEEGEYQVDEVDGEQIVSADTLEGLQEARLRDGPQPREGMPRGILDVRLDVDAMEESADGEPNDYRVPPPEGGRLPPPQVAFLLHTTYHETEFPNRWSEKE